MKNSGPQTAWPTMVRSMLLLAMLSASSVVSLTNKEAKNQIRELLGVGGIRWLLHGIDGVYYFVCRAAWLEFASPSLTPP